MIVTRYWLTPDGTPRVEKIDWWTFPNNGHPVMIPDIPEDAYIDDASLVGLQVGWVSIVQPAFTGTPEQWEDPYAKALTPGVTVVDETTYNETLADLEAAAIAARQAEAATRLEAATRREELIRQLADQVEPPMNESDIRLLIDGA